VTGFGGRHQVKWEQAHARGHVDRRQYLASSLTSLGFAALCLIALLAPYVHGFDAVIRRGIGTLWWDLAAITLAFGWMLLGLSYLVCRGGFFRPEVAPLVVAAVDSLIDRASDPCIRPERGSRERAWTVTGL
jgi:hypothetical protein